MIQLQGERQSDRASWRRWSAESWKEYLALPTWPGHLTLLITTMHKLLRGTIRRQFQSHRLPTSCGRKRALVNFLENPSDILVEADQLKLAWKVQTDRLTFPPPNLLCSWWERKMSIWEKVPLWETSGNWLCESQDRVKNRILSSSNWNHHCALMAGENNVIWLFHWVISGNMKTFFQHWKSVCIGRVSRCFVLHPPFRGPLVCPQQTLVPPETQLN